MDELEDEFFSDDSDSDSNASFPDEPDNYDPNNFGDLYQHKQVETLKFLRMTLKENKILKRRINYIENELDRYQDFKGVLPVAEEKRSVTAESEEKINEDFLITTDDKECQTDLLLISEDRAKTKTPQQMIKEITSKSISVKSDNSCLSAYTTVPNTKSISNKEVNTTDELNFKSVESFTQITELTDGKDDSQLEVYQLPEIVKLDKACQWEDLEPKQVEVKAQFKEEPKEAVVVSDSAVVNGLKKDNADLKKERDGLREEVESMNGKIRELKVNNKKLMEKYDNMMSSHELTSGLLEDAKNQMLVLKENNDHLEEYKNRYGILTVEREELNRQNNQLQIQMKSKQDEITKLNETITVLSSNFEIMDKQREKIAFLEAECEKHLNEKHIVCERRIAELTQECQNNVGFIEAQKNQLRTLKSNVEDLEKQMEKNKIELQSFNFKEFIALKRELGQMKQEREKQFAESMAKKATREIKSKPEPLPLPPIQHSTEVKEKKTSFKFFH